MSKITKRSVDALRPALNGDVFAWDNELDSASESNPPAKKISRWISTAVPAPRKLLLTSMSARAGGAHSLSETDQGKRAVAVCIRLLDRLLSSTGLRCAMVKPKSGSKHRFFTSNEKLARFLLATPEP